MLRLNRTGNPINRNERNDINENWDNIERDFNNVVNVISDTAYQRVVDSAKLIWQEPVNVFADLATTYPTAQVGWTAWTRETVNGVSKAYRYNGSQWVEQQQFLGDAINEVNNRLILVDTGLKKRIDEITINVLDYGAIQGDNDSNALTNSNAIQQAIDLANSLGGGTVFFPPGTYIINPRNLRIKSNVEILGYNATLKNPNNVGDYFSMFEFTPNSSNINIRGLNFDANDTKSANPNADISFLRGTVTNPVIGSAHAIIYGGGVSNLLVEDCVFLHAGTVALLVDGYQTASNIVVRNNRFSWYRGNGSTYGVPGYYDNTMLYLQNLSNVIIDGNIFETNEISDWSTNCIDVGRNNVKVINNTTINCQHFMDIGSGGSGFIIENNTLVNTADGVKFWQDTNDVIISNNVFQCNLELYLDNNINNFAFGKLLAPVGFRTLSPGLTYKNVKISNNIFNNVSTRYEATDVANVQAVVSNFGTTTNYFIDAVIDNNIFEGFGGYQVFFNLGAQNSVKLKITDNTVKSANRLADSVFFGINSTNINNQILVQNNTIDNDANSEQIFTLLSAIDPNIQNLLVINNKNNKQKSFRLNQQAIMDNFVSFANYFEFGKRFHNYTSGKLTIYTGEVLINDTQIRRCSRFGTLGTLNGLTVTGGVAPNRRLTISAGDINQLSTGDYIAITGAANNFYVVGSVRNSDNTFTLSAQSGTATVVNVTNAAVNFLTPDFVNIGG